MASWILSNTSFALPNISRLIPKPALLTRHTRLLPYVTSKAFASALSVSVDLDPSDMTPSMEEMLKQPERRSGWDRSLFEDITDEYDQTEMVGENGEQRKPCHVLLQLVEENDFKSAKRVRDELQKFGIAIQPDPRYMVAAIDALRPHIEERCLFSEFNSWAALVPTPEALHETPFFQSNSFTKLRDQKAATLRHAVIAAHMGYSSKVALRIVPWALKEATIAAGRGFMQAFADADLAYRRAAHSSRAVYEHHKHFKSWYALAIRTRTVGNDTRAACTLLRDALSREYRVPLFTLRFLLDKLHDKHDRKNASWVAKKYWTLKEKDFASPEVLTVKRKNLLAIQIRSVLRAGHIPNRARLRSLIHLCVSSGDTQLFHNMLHRFHNHRWYERAIRQWATAEISYYFDHGQELAALYVFRQYFRTAGIPKAVESMLDKLDYGSLPEYIRTRSIPHPAAIWPDFRVTIILWQLLLKAVKQHQVKYMFLEFESLYDAYALLKSPHPSASPASLEQAYNLLAKGRIPPPTALHPFGLDHFRQFLHAISKYNDTLLLVSVIKKMRTLGWHPRKGDLSAITDCFARGGSPERLIPLLEELRSDYERQPRQRTRRDIRNRDDTPQPMATVMYRKAVRSMMGVRRYAGAAKIARHLRRKVGYQFGMHKKTDRTLGILYTELKRGSPKTTRAAASSSEAPLL